MYSETDDAAFAGVFARDSTLDRCSRTIIPSSSSSSWGAAHSAPEGDGCEWLTQLDIARHERRGLFGATGVVQLPVIGSTDNNYAGS